MSTKKYARAYQAASKKDKGRIWDQVVEVTSWNRGPARQQLKARLCQVPGRASATVAVIDRHHTKACQLRFSPHSTIRCHHTCPSSVSMYTLPGATWQSASVGTGVSPRIPDLRISRISASL
ncbi:hypothetical protein O6R08_07080 [Cutibacterium equinum]|uniref:Uncharacterized protein n=1 Tax=Cutibacterium equinum TaxID=3016342 RepID=A0ABY7QW68_9ACTN|nr:hypothetical protein [Cutibacterium equinum]WCC79303.1 hypothetical protein O6R08_07080 [Cutibacterium equinum]